ncbi:MAG: hydrogenase accessory protein [Pseudomonadota bacterium]
MTHPLIEWLTEEFGWPRLDTAAGLDAWIARPGTHVLFIPGDWRRNLETADVAVILPELHAAFQDRFDCAVVDEAVETIAKEKAGIFKTPSLIFYRDGACLGGIPNVRDWNDYMTRVAHFLDMPVAAA